MSAWSVSRTTLGFWGLLKVISLIRHGRPEINWAALSYWAPLASFFAIVAASLLPDFHSAGDFRYLAFAVAHAVMIVDVFAASDRRRWLLQLMALAPVILVVRGLIDAPEVFKFRLDYRFDHPLDHANTAGYLLAMSIPLCLYVVQAGRGWRRWLAAVVCFGEVVALLLTYSRGAWLGLSAAMVFFAFITNRWKSFLAMLAVVAICLTGFPSLRERAFSVLRPLHDPALSDRLRIGHDAFRLGLEQPILGVGYGRGRLKDALRSRYNYTPSEHGPIWHTHNVYIELFAETGILGLGTFGWLMVSTLYRLLRSVLAEANSSRLLGVSLATSWVAAAVAGLGDIPFYHHEPRIFFFSLFALAHLTCPLAGKRVN
ncbi:MAG: hypothetical protein FJ143_06660 [Deltaproteobacteria bacterium]|nr:hypothetical protein [Deltaproteobacteria bacterium]